VHSSDIWVRLAWNFSQCTHTLSQHKQDSQQTVLNSSPPHANTHMLWPPGQREKFWEAWKRKGMPRQGKARGKPSKTRGKCEGWSGRRNRRCPTARRPCEVHKATGQTENRKEKPGRESRRRKLSAVRSATCQRVLPAAILRRNNRTNVGGCDGVWLGAETQEPWPWHTGSSWPALRFRLSRQTLWIIQLKGLFFYCQHCCHSLAHTWPDRV